MGMFDVFECFRKMDPNKKSVQIKMILINYLLKINIRIQLFPGVTLKVKE